MSDKLGKVLIVDDDPDILKSLKQMLKYDFEEVALLNTPLHISALLKKKDFDVILLDMNFTWGDSSGRDGLIWLKDIIKKDPSAMVVLTTAYADIDLAVKGVKQGAFDFIVKPWEPQKLIATLSSAIRLRKTKLENHKLKQKNKAISQNIGHTSNTIIGQSSTIQQVLKIVKKIAKTDANILILGENGTGKELIANEIHKLSHRKEKIFLPLDMGTINEHLFESELFGHTKGAFTDAYIEKSGKFEAADGGTLFLDEIGNLPLSLQTKLLRTIQEGTITKIGETIPKKVDCRLIFATNKNLEDMVNKEIFRKDLYYRINTITILLPSLRNREGDIPLLAEFYLRKYQEKYNKGNIKITQNALTALQAYEWPGNIRELKHTMEKAVILNDNGILTAEDFFAPTYKNINEVCLNTLDLIKLEKTALQKALKIAAGNMSKAAQILNISRTTLYSKLKKHGL